jgi:hypothetical protein
MCLYNINHIQINHIEINIYVQSDSFGWDVAPNVCSVAILLSVVLSSIPQRLWIFRIASWEVWFFVVVVQNKYSDRRVVRIVTSNRYYRSGKRFLDLYLFRSSYGTIPRPSSVSTLRSNKSNGGMNEYHFVWFVGL